MSDKATKSCMENPTLGVLCACLGQIPVGKQSLPDSKLPIDWDVFSKVNWEQFIFKVQAEGLAPLLYWVLSRSGKFSSIPEKARNSLRTTYSRTWMKNQKIFKELETLGQACKLAGIQLVVLKGACFALTIYLDIGLRPMGDLDVLVPGSKWSEALRIAKSLGYVDAVPEVSPGLNDMLKHEICLQKTGSPTITLEIHHSLVAGRSFRYAVPVNWVWGQTEPMDGSPSEGRFENLCMLTPTAQVLYAASHAMLQHGGSNPPLRWFYDLDRLIRFYAGRVDWDLLLSRALIFEWSSAMDAALSKTVACFDTPIPEHVLTSLSGISDRYRQLVVLKQKYPTVHLLDIYQDFLSLNWYGRLRMVLALIVPSPVFMQWRYHLKSSRLLPVYYLFRWWGILKKRVSCSYCINKKKSSYGPSQTLKVSSVITRHDWQDSFTYQNNLSKENLMGQQVQAFHRFLV